MKKILLIGTGYMSREYAKVLINLGIPFIVIGRGEERCEEFRSIYPSIETFSGGLNNFLQSHSIDTYSTAIVAITLSELKNETKILIENGIKNILVEKPAGLDYSEIKELYECASKYQTDVFVAYNRRFYASVIKARELIKNEGGVSSFCFEFTEWGHQIKDLPTADKIKQNWFLANSSHVVDLAFFLGGYPLEISSYRAGGLSWHTKTSKFAGAGICENDVLFSYCANWDAPGRWGIEVLTRESRFIFRPLEKLSKIKKGSIVVEEVPIDNSLDVKFKPGLYLQTKAFLEKDTVSLCSLKEHKKIIEKYYLQISSYSQ